MRFLIFSDFRVCVFVYFHCMNVCLTLIQPLGCQNPINVMLVMKFVNYVDSFWCITYEFVSKICNFHEDQSTVTHSPAIAALKFCFKTCVAMKYVDDDDTQVSLKITIQDEPETRFLASNMVFAIRMSAHPSVRPSDVIHAWTVKIWRVIFTFYDTAIFIVCWGQIL